jgi:hypothetical protein
MKVIYIAKHGQFSTSNDDEGAITHALRLLGHMVQEINERSVLFPQNIEGDLCLFHKWDAVEDVQKLRMPKVFWYFDLVDWPDPTLVARFASRREWFSRVLPVADLGFCTDGDWAAKDETGKLEWLPQGFDTRQTEAPVTWEYDLLFTGRGRDGGQGRADWLKAVSNLGYDLLWVERGVYGPALADLTARSKITLCPDEPVTDRYWSNRVYNALGYGGFVLHPYCAKLAEQYRNGVHLHYYSNLGELKAKVAYWLDPKRDAERARIAAAGREWTFIAYSYLRRVQVLLDTVKVRLGVG